MNKNVEIAETETLYKILAHKFMNEQYIHFDCGKKYIDLNIVKKLIAESEERSNTLTYSNHKNNEQDNFDYDLIYTKFINYSQTPYIKDMNQASYSSTRFTYLITKQNNNVK
jgi:hypothetical protein